MIKGGEMARECPNCYSKRNWRDGVRETNFGEVQRFICRDCGFRFSEKSYKDSLLSQNSQLCAVLEEAKKLGAATEIKTVAGEKESSLIEYAWRLKKKGLGDSTISLRCGILQTLAKKGADLNNPESVETILATEPEYTDKTKPSKKYNTVKAYVSYTKTLKIFWEGIKVTYEPKQAFVGTPEERQLFINSAGHRLGTYLQVTSDTGARRGEVAHIKWTDIDTKAHTISINQPEKNSRSRLLKVPEATILRIQTLSHKYDPYIFNPDPHSKGTQFEDLRKKVVRENPGNADRLKLIHLHSFRYGFAHKLIKQLKPQKLVQQNLGHKSSASTDRYTNTVVFSDTDWETARATTIEEAEKLASQGYTKYDEINGVHLYRRVKP
jgi:integrase